MSQALKWKWPYLQGHKPRFTGPQVACEILAISSFHEISELETEP